MDINNLNEKNLIITTSYGSIIEIKNNQTICFNNQEISLQKIKNVGDANVGITNKNFESEIIKLTSHKKYSGILSIISFSILIPTYISYRNSERVARALGLGKQDNSPVYLLFFIFIAVVFYYLFTKGRISSIQKLDFSKNDYPLSITIELLDGGKKITKNFIVGKGSMEELNDLKSLILSRKVKSLLT